MVRGYKNCLLATLTVGQANYGLVSNGALIVDEGRIVYAGAFEDLPDEFSRVSLEDLEGRLITPGFVDCHSHVIFGGDRAREFEMRLEGASYEEIARAGGGIVSTVNATRAASEKDLLKGALSRVDALISEGVTTLEVKSGYGLNHETELMMLRVARSISNHRAIEIKTSFLGAHAVPVEYKDNADAYIDDVVLPCLKQAHSQGLVDAVDGFCEGIAFSPSQIAKVFDCAKELGLPVKLHAEQLSNLGGAKLAAQYGALSADHIEYLDEEGVCALSKSGSVAVLLPGAFYTLRETQMPPVDLLRQHQVPIAIATDCNPGSSPLTSLLLTMNMACTLFRLTPEEALRGVTCNAARALGLSDRGQLVAGQRADLAIWDVRHPAELSYRIGFNALYKRIIGGSK